jgi:hypothetical protein
MKNVLKCLDILETEICNGGWVKKDMETLDLITQARAEVALNERRDNVFKLQSDEWDNITKLFHQQLVAINKRNIQFNRIMMFCAALLVVSLLVQAWITDSNFARICNTIAAGIWVFVFFTNAKFYRKNRLEEKKEEVSQ